MRPDTLRRVALLAAVCAATAGLAACSAGPIGSDYTSPIAATSAPPPHPVVPVVASGAGVHPGRLPLLPPVPGEEQSGLPPVTMAQLLPPDLR